jgi:hypothetical protein
MKTIFCPFSKMGIRMKKRSGFVSNSSSSSFIIIGSGKIEKPDIIDSDA